MSPDTVLAIGAAVLVVAIVLVGVLLSETCTVPASPSAAYGEVPDPDTAYETADTTDWRYRTGGAR